MSAVIVVLGPSGLAVGRRIQKVLPQAELHGFAPRVSGVDEMFSDTMEHLRTCFRAGREIIGVCSSGILIRAIGPLLVDKHRESTVVAVAEDGSAVVPLVGGHHGANTLAQQLAYELSGFAAVTTAGDVSLGVALDEPPAGWELLNPEATKHVTAELLAGAPAAVSSELSWLNGAGIEREANAAIRLSSAISPVSPHDQELAYCPKRAVVGVGSDRGCPASDLISLVDAAVAEADLLPEAIACVVSLDRKADEAAVHALAAHLKVPARFFGVGDIQAVEDLIPNPSETVKTEVGVAGVAEGAALAASGARKLLVEKRKSQRATCAIALADEIIDPAVIGRARGSISVVGVGPGTPAWRSAEATNLLRGSTDWVGYGLYLDLVADLRHNQDEHRFPLGDEEVRVRHALELAGEGRNVALVCSGDAGIYAMAALVCEVLALGPEASGLSDGAHRADVTIAPGISAVQAAAARAGAPIGHDFCCISLSDLLTPWPAIERRIKAAANADFVVAFYNPRSMRRRDQLVRAIEVLGANRPPDTPVIIASSLGRPEEKLVFQTIGTMHPEDVDMLSIVIVGASSSQMFSRGDGQSMMFTPRGYAAKREAAE